MTLDLTKPVQTRDGRKVRILCTDAGGRFPVVALVQYDKSGNDPTETPLTFDRNGHQFVDDEEPFLINVPERLTGWANIYAGVGGSFSVGPVVHPTREAADEAASRLLQVGGHKRIGCAPIDTEKLT